MGNLSSSIRKKSEDEEKIVASGSPSITLNQSSTETSLNELYGLPQDWSFFSNRSTQDDFDLSPLEVKSHEEDKLDIMQLYLPSSYLNLNHQEKSRDSSKSCCCCNWRRIASLFRFSSAHAFAVYLQTVIGFIITLLLCIILCSILFIF